MYGFPTQTEQETIDSLEMVRQMFAEGVLQSAFWHLFTMTAHSPVGLEPEKYRVRKKVEAVGSFANNDIEHTDPTGADHEQFGFGLKKALHNYMHGTCLDLPLQKWFDFKVPKTTVAPGFIHDAINEPEYAPGLTQKLVWIGNMPRTSMVTRSKKGNTWEMMEMIFPTKRSELSIQVDPEKGKWLLNTLPKIHVSNATQLTAQMLKADYENAGLEDFELFWDNKPVNTLYKAGLLRL
jgi:hypothetical protein